MARGKGVGCPMGNDCPIPELMSDVRESLGVTNGKIWAILSLLGGNLAVSVLALIITH